MPQYVAAALTRHADGWDARELDLDDVEDLDEVAELLRDVAADLDEGGPALLLLEEDDEYVAVVRVDGDTDPRVFLSDARATRTSNLATLLAVDAEPALDEDDEDDDEGTKPETEPVGDADLLVDLGTSAGELLELCNREGLLPADVITELCRAAGCVDELEALREV